MNPSFCGLCALLLCALGASSSAQDTFDGTSCNSRAATSAQTQRGLFTVHQRCGHILYEIPVIMLDRVMLINTEFAALKEREGDAQTSGRFADTRVVRWVRQAD